VDYPIYAKALCDKITSGEFSHGVLICGTGIGVSIAANKVNGIRAALCHDYFTAKMCGAHHDSNVLCMGARVIGIEVGKQMVEAFLSSSLNTSNPNYQRRLDQIRDLEGPKSD
jgi:ribose 5-phosphate isomerase B